MDPVSSHAPPRPIYSAVNLFFRLYLFSKSVISNSFLLDGFKVFARLITLLSKKYKPVIAKSDINFFGFSLIDTILLFFIFATPNFSGLITLCKITFEPLFNLTHSNRVFVND